MHPAIRRIAFLSCLAASLLAVVWPAGALAQAGSFEEGLAAYKAGRNQDAERIWMPLAEGGDPLAQYSLGKLYETGRSGAPDFEAAARWYGLAAQQDMAAAQNNLGLMYAQGRGVPRDPVRAAQLWSRSANSSNPMAQYNLGLAYFRGEGVGQDQVEAAVWFHLAADAGVSEAQFALGQMHRLGLALPQDERRALHWYQRAAGKGHKDARVQAERLRAQGVQAAQPLDVVSSDPLEGGAPARQTAAGGGDDRKPSLVEGGGGTEGGQGTRPRATTVSPAPAAPVASARPAQPAQQGDKGGFQLQSRLLTPVPPTKKAVEKSATQENSPPQEASGNTAPVQTARREVAPREAAPRQAAPRPAAKDQDGVFLWLLSSADETQAKDLLKEAEKDYAGVLEGQALTLLQAETSGRGALYRLVVAAESQAEAEAACQKIRQINAEAFCSILVR